MTACTTPAPTGTSGASTAAAGARHNPNDVEWTQHGGNPDGQFYSKLDQVNVNVFRAPAALPDIAAEAVAIGAGCLWCQFTVINAEGARIAEDGGLSVVMDRCIKVEHARYAGRMHWLGFNAHQITSLRGGLQ